MRYRHRNTKKIQQQLEAISTIHNSCPTISYISTPRQCYIWATETNRILTLFSTWLNSKCGANICLLWLIAMWKSLSVLQHRTWYQTGIQINAISLKRLHVVNKIAGFQRLDTEGRSMFIVFNWYGNRVKINKCRSDNCLALKPPIN